MTCDFLTSTDFVGRPRAAAGTRVQTSAPRPYITKDELSSCSGYLAGRLTVQKVNAALEELAGARQLDDDLRSGCVWLVISSKHASQSLCTQGSSVHRVS
jgi:Spindle and kinetochore-associated protein 1